MYVKNKEKIFVMILNCFMVSWINVILFVENFVEIYLFFMVLVLEWNESRRGFYVGLKFEGNE